MSLPALLGGVGASLLVGPTIACCKSSTTVALSLHRGGCGDSDGHTDITCIQKQAIAAACSVQYVNYLTSTAPRVIQSLQGWGVVWGVGVQNSGASTSGSCGRCFGVPKIFVENAVKPKCQFHDFVRKCGRLPLSAVARTTHLLPASRSIVYLYHSKLPTATRVHHTDQIYKSAGTKDTYCAISRL